MKLNKSAIHGAIALCFSFFLFVPSFSAAQVNGKPDTTKRDSIRALVAKLTPPPPAVPIDSLRAIDSVTASPGRTYNAGFLHRAIFGDLNRHLWVIPVPAPVFTLDTLGGLSVSEVSGGKQTLGLRLVSAADSVTYQFRSVVKDPSRAFPSAVSWTPVVKVAEDFMAAQFPLGPLVVAELLDAVDVLVAKPKLVVMGNDPKLGEYRSAFAGRMGWIEQRPQGAEGERPGFANSEKIDDTEELYKELIEDSRSYVNVESMLRARMVDFIVGDWDRHSDQYRWARFKDGDRMRWEPIPRDRDWAFSRLDGLLPLVWSRYYVQFRGFSSEYPRMLHLAWAGQRVDRRLLASVDRKMMMDAASNVQSTLTDKVLADAVATLPASYKPHGDYIYNAMRMRRDSLQSAASEFYKLLAAEPGVNGTHKADSLIISASGSNMRVQLREAGANGLAFFDRTFVRGETEEVRIFLHDGDDKVNITESGDLPIRVRIVTGGDKDIVVDKTSGRNVYVYNSAGDDELELGRKAFSTDNAYLGQDSIRTAKMIWNKRDWGSAFYALPKIDHEPDIGFLLGLRMNRYEHGFGQNACNSCVSLELLGAMRQSEWIVNLGWDQLISAGGLWFSNSAELYTGRPNRLFGFGNEIDPSSGEAGNTAFRQTLDVRSGLKYEPDSTYNLTGGLVWRRSGNLRDGGPIFATLPYGSGNFEQAGVGGALEIDTRDNRRLPNRGMVLRMNADYYPSLLDVESPYTTARATMRWYRSIPLPMQPALHLRAVGQKVWGTAPFYDMALLGGSSSLPGFSRQQWRGDAMVSGSALLRARVFSAKLLTDMDFGAHGVTSAGRVWLDGEESSTWHRANGYGIWIHLPAIGRTLSITQAHGNKTRTYLDFGFIF